MNLYYQPDSIWKIFAASTPEEYIEKFVVVGHFHKDVPEDVVKSYKTVEHALALAYYYFPLIDLAVNKLLGIYEMAIKLRCDELGIEKTYIDKKGKTQKKNLNSLIDELIKNGLIPDFKTVLHNLRRIRNITAHPENDSTMAFISRRFIKPSINIINQIFLPKTHHISCKHEFENSKNKFIIDPLELFILENRNLRILVNEPRFKDNVMVNNEWIQVFTFEPVLAETFKTISNLNLTQEIVLFLKDFKYENGNIYAFDLVLNKEVCIEKTTKPENIQVFEKHLDELHKLENSDRRTYLMVKEENVDFEVQNFTYQYCWE